MLRDLGVGRRGAEGAGRLPRTPRRTDHRADDSNHPRPGHPVAHSRNHVAHTGTRPRGHNTQPVDQGSRRTGEAEHPGIGGSGLCLAGGGGSTSGLAPLCPLWSLLRVLVLLSRLLLLRSALWLGHGRLLLRGLLPRRVLRQLRVRRLRREPRLLLWVRRLLLVPRRLLRVRQLLRIPRLLLRVRWPRLVRLLLLLLSALLLGRSRLPRSRLASLGRDVWRDRRWCRVYCWSLPGSQGAGLRYVQRSWVY